MVNNGASFNMILRDNLAYHVLVREHGCPGRSFVQFHPFNCFTYHNFIEQVIIWFLRVFPFIVFKEIIVSFPWNKTYIPCLLYCVRYKWWIEISFFRCAYNLYIFHVHFNVLHYKPRRLIFSFLAHYSPINNQIKMIRYTNFEN